MRRFLLFVQPRRIALAGVILYICAAAVSMVVAHILLIARPESGLAERIIAPVARGLEFLDDHWKVVVLLVAPFAVPLLRDLLTRLRRFGDVEFDPVHLEPVGVREKPAETSGERSS